MEKFKILYQTSAWFIPICILVGLAYAYFLYSISKSWGKTTNRFLFALRFLTVFIICFLLTGPLIQLIKNRFEKPTIVFAIDNSESLKLATDTNSFTQIVQQSDQLITQLQQKNFDYEIVSLNTDKTYNSPLEIVCDYKSTDLSSILNTVESNFANRKLAATILITDGIYNTGIDPLYKKYSYPIYTLGMGDTIDKKDIVLKKLVYNRIAYSGNQYPIVAEIQNSGFTNQSISILLKQGKKTLQKKNVDLKGRTHIETEFIVSSPKPGLQHLVVEIEPLAEEYTDKNNSAHAYIEILDAKERILIAAPGPHPDIKALKAAIESKESYEVEVFIPGIFPLKESKYDLVIFHQIPDIKRNTDSYLEKLKSLSSAHLYIIGNQSNLQKFNQDNGIISISGSNNQTDLTSIGLNPTFEKFKLDQESVNTLAKSPPLTTPFGNYKTHGDAETILYQKIGSVITENPLLAIKSEGGKKSGVLTGEGIWTWPIYERKNTNSTAVFDKFITSLVQYLSSKEDKRKFRLRPIQHEFSESEKILFDAQVYNDIHEPVYSKKIQLNIKDENNKAYQYTFSPNPDNRNFEVKGLKTGLYSYVGTVELDGKVHKEIGEFLIQEVMLEAINITANHHMLRELSAKNRGKFYTANQVQELSNDLLQQLDSRPIIHSTEEFEEMIHLVWILALLILLLTIEWGIRKYAGHY
jgi:hypothetical protein